MPYDGDMTWADLSRIAERNARELKREIRNGKEAYREWLSFRDGRNDATITTDLGGLPLVEADVTALRLCFKAMDEIADFADNVASPVQGDRYAALRKFS